MEKFTILHTRNGVIVEKTIYYTEDQDTGIMLADVWMFAHKHCKHYADIDEDSSVYLYYFNDMIQVLHN